MKRKELINDVNDFIISTDNLRLDVNNMIEEYRRTNENCKKLLEDINNSNKIIETLTTHNFVGNQAYAAVVLIPYRGKPTFVKDGKVIADNASEVTMTWDAYEHSVRFSVENN